MLQQIFSLDSRRTVQQLEAFVQALRNLSAVEPEPIRRALLVDGASYCIAFADMRWIAR